MSQGASELAHNLKINFETVDSAFACSYELSWCPEPGECFFFFLLCVRERIKGEKTAYTVVWRQRWRGWNSSQTAHCHLSNSSLWEGNRTEARCEWQPRCFPQRCREDYLIYPTRKHKDAQNCRRLSKLLGAVCLFLAEAWLLSPEMTPAGRRSWRVQNKNSLNGAIWSNSLFCSLSRELSRNSELPFLVVFFLLLFFHSCTLTCWNCTDEHPQSCSICASPVLIM